MSAPNINREMIAAQADTVVRGVFGARPFAAAIEATHGAIIHLFTVGMGEFALGIPASTVVDGHLAPATTVYPQSRVARGTFPLQSLSAIEFGLYLVATLGIGAAWFSRVPGGAPPVASGHPRVNIFVEMLVGGIVTNAVVSGVLSDVF